MYIHRSFSCNCVVICEILLTIDPLLQIKVTKISIFLFLISVCENAPINSSEAGLIFEVSPSEAVTIFEEAGEYESNATTPIISVDLTEQEVTLLGFYAVLENVEKVVISPYLGDTESNNSKVFFEKFVKRKYKIKIYV